MGAEEGAKSLNGGASGRAGARNQDGSIMSSFGNNDFGNNDFGDDIFSPQPWGDMNWPTMDWPVMDWGFPAWDDFNPATPIDPIMPMGEDDDLGSCCFKIGYGAMMKPCCLNIVDASSEEECMTGSRLGGATGWAEQCPTSAEEASDILAEQSAQSDDDGTGNDDNDNDDDDDDDDDSTTTTPTPSVSGQQDGPCCFMIGYGSMMKPCCLTITNATSEGECLAGNTKRAGGATGWAEQCPSTADDASVLVEQQSSSSDDSSPSTTDDNGNSTSN